MYLGNQKARMIAADNGIVAAVAPVAAADVTAVENTDESVFIGNYVPEHWVEEAQTVEARVESEAQTQSV